MSDISTEITRLETAKNTLVTAMNTICPKLFNSDTPPTIDNIANVIASFQTKLSGTILIHSVASVDTLESLLTKAQNEQRPVVIFMIINTSLATNLSTIKIKESYGAYFINLKTRISYTIGDYSLSDSEVGDVYILDPTEIFESAPAFLQKFNVSAIEATAAKHILSTVASLPSISDRS